MLVKYAGEALSLWLANGRFMTPLDFLNPLLSVRMELLKGAPEWLGLAWVLWSLPFLWIAISMSVRRAVNAGITPLPGLLVLIPLVNLVTMLLLTLLPENKPAYAGERQAIENSVSWVRAALLGLLAGSALGMVMLALAVYALRSYGGALFLGTPVMIGVTAAVVWNFQQRRGYGASALLGMFTAVLAGGVMLMFALEGAICIFMAAPLALPLGALGGMLGQFIADCRPDARTTTLGMLLILPGWAGVEKNAWPPEEFTVQSEVLIDAPIQRVWDTVIGFPEIPPPREWYFRYGIAYPIRGRIFGRGAGAVRHCVFSTGTFVEPITVWDEPKRLAFSVAEQPVPMFELSPWKNVHPPHLDGALRSTHGEFVLEELPGGRTRLIGRSWYQFDMHPRDYWTMWGNLMIDRIHHRVLDHVKVHAEMPADGEASR